MSAPTSVPFVPPAQFPDEDRAAPVYQQFPSQMAPQQGAYVYVQQPPPEVSAVKKEEEVNVAQIFFFVGWCFPFLWWIGCGQAALKKTARTTFDFLNVIFGTILLGFVGSKEMMAASRIITGPTSLISQTLMLKEVKMSNNRSPVDGRIRLRSLIWNPSQPIVCGKSRITSPYPVSLMNCGNVNGQYLGCGVLCCSKYGFCGKTDEHCKAGCQTVFGRCK
ncbi:hypothetical protein HDV02_002466 [Globomyces sp. JEL0801]|nr:hypothetical protein HDV02_002466 [Globomyces sp. JEL0801]